MKYLFEEIARDRAENPLYGEHVALYRRYTDEQCDELEQKNRLGVALGFGFPWERTETDEKLLRACAGILRGLGAAQLRTGKASHFSLNRERYVALGSRYHDGDPRNTYSYTRHAVERLAASIRMPARRWHGQVVRLLLEGKGRPVTFEIWLSPSASPIRGAVRSTPRWMSRATSRRRPDSSV